MEAHAPLLEAVISTPASIWRGGGYPPTVIREPARVSILDALSGARFPRERVGSRALGIALPNWWALGIAPPNTVVGLQSHPCTSLPGT